MATLMPSGRPSMTHGVLTTEGLDTTLRLWHRRYLTQQTFLWSIRGLIAGLVVAGIILLIARLLPWGAAPYWAIGLGLTCLLFTLGGALWLRPSLSDTAQAIDEHLRLHNRIATAWELREQTSIFSHLQRKDALQHLRQHTPAQSIPLRISRSTFLTFALLLIIIALFLILPNPMNDLARQQAAFQSQVTQQVQAIEKARQELLHQSNVPETQKQQTDQILRDLQTKLQQAKNGTEAQQDIAEAQAKLDQLRDPQLGNRVQGQVAASSALQSSSNTNLQAAGQALSNNDSKGLADALQKLATQANKLSPGERSQLAKQIENAANQAGQNPDLSSTLHQLAKAVDDGNPSEIADATNAVKAAAAKGAKDQAQNSALNKASQSLQQSANNLAASTDPSSQGQQGNQGQGSQGQQGQQGTQGQGQGNQGQQGQQGQQGNQGQGQGQQGTQGQGQGNQGQGNQGQGNQGQGGQGNSNNAGNQSGRSEQVFVPGQTGQGDSTQSNDNTNSVVQQGDQLPYSQVIQRYNQMAHDQIDNSNVSPDMKDLVHDYFNTLEGQ